LEELELRWGRLRALLTEHMPQAGGILVFSRLNIYYMTGTFGNGMLWLPIEGSPVFLCRRGQERAGAESPLEAIIPFRSYQEVSGLLRGARSPLTDTFAAEMNGLSWALAKSLMKYLGEYQITSGDHIISMARAVKTPHELALMREAGTRHNHCQVETLPARIRPGMTEMAIARALSDVFLEHGHHGILRMEKYGEEAYMGHISSGDSANYPSVFNGALGLRGMHPAVPHMGSAEKVWAEGEVMMVDTGFSYQGYQTDKSNVFWAGGRDAIPARVRKAHEFCVEMQGWVASALKPGAIPSEIWKHCAGWAEREGFGEGFMGLAANKVAFVGHGIGLAIDEFPVLAEGFDLPLEAGMVLAVEPKMGIEGTGMVGIEDTFEVTAEGGVSLTGSEYDIICV
jgi:Xaa-Pro dipeptidase